MPIEALPESTSRAIGSTLVLGDARSVVKELLDNALDAQATSINIEISTNTLDVIQVRDNGTGIAAQDRPLLCKRGCTSKIRSLNDLSRLGGTFLGFRGEALASIVELSKAVIITSRLHGEMVGTSLEFDSSGTSSSSSASHPLGTTFRVQNFLQEIPVRRQTALKHAARTLQSVKAMLATYAFARPRVRFSFKVLKAKSDQANWTYAPGPKDTLLDIASKVVGKEIVSSCTIESAKDESLVDSENGWELEALLLLPGTDSKSRNLGSYISIDGRPVASNRATIKEILKIYKRYYQATISTSSNLSSSKLFIFLRINCPPESYDVNIEPAKDEVLFFNPSRLLSLCEALFQKVYGRLKDREVDSALSSQDHSTKPTKNTMLSIAGPQGLSGHPTIFEIPSTPAADSPIDQGVMSGPFTIAAMKNRVLPSSNDTAQHERSCNLSSNRLPDDFNNEDARLPTTRRTSLTEIQPPQVSQLLSPSPSPIIESRYQNPGPPMRRRARATSGVEPQDSDSPHQQATSQSSSRRTVLQAWLTPQTQKRRPPLPSPTRLPISGSSRGLSDQHDSILGSPEPTENQRTLANEVLHVGQRQKPFVIPFKASSAGLAREQSTAMTAISPADSSQLINETTSTGSPSEQSEPSQRRLSLPLTQRTVQDNTELQEIMDFEHRKKAAIAYQRRTALGQPPKPISDVLGISRRGGEWESIASEEQASSLQRTNVMTADQDAFNERFGQPQTRPSKSPQPRSRHTPVNMGSSMLTPRFESVQQDSDHLTPARSPSPVSSFLSSNDPRAYLIRTRQRSTTNKACRIKSTQLPLETIPDEWSTLPLTCTVELEEGVDSIKNLVQLLTTVDTYVSQGANTYVQFPKLDKAQDWQEKLRQMITTQYHSQDGGDMRTISKSLAISLTIMEE
ncbi:hypothetical protein PV10_03252 [Exophiala mesophila]|uniref:DNA mismatch repair protein S5 domain-containing protein n=1 Tax=Exophiala mesophila TaxID=212818 RepID=A0A0D1ZLY0_EXOME|nr:uncharacterized protein PV10_03252 [Exophiala mesophila]KIV95622.1 hypothetical protein PV10_03252 [Exophiala mesophila]